MPTWRNLDDLAPSEVLAWLQEATHLTLDQCPALVRYIRVERDHGTSAEDLTRAMHALVLRSIADGWADRESTRRLALYALDAM